jgi:poly-gamma-glutamate capsule biosynthesis protein CapA/YwtB (metallophosphatase superfamily)
MNKKFLIMFFLFVSACTPRETGKLTISAIGDIMMHYRVQEYALSDKNGYRTLFEPAEKIFLNDDLTIGNLETPVCDNLPIAGYPLFNARSALLDAIKSSGIEILSLANNHSLDQGVDGILSTVNELKKRNLIFAGTGENPEEAKKHAVINKNGIKLAYISATESSNNPQSRKDKKAHVNIISYYDKKALNDYCDEIKKIKKEADVVILSYHAGIEYESEADPDKIRVMKLFAESGADVILGHHPHVLQKIEFYNTKDNRKSLLVYSLGNYISAQARYITELNKGNLWECDSRLSKTAESIILRFDITKKGNQISISNAGMIPVLNVCFSYKQDKKYMIGYKTFLIRDILDENSKIYDDMIVDRRSLKIMSEYRLRKIKEQINIPVISIDIGCLAVKSPQPPLIKGVICEANRRISRAILQVTSDILSLWQLRPRVSK